MAVTKRSGPDPGREDLVGVVIEATYNWYWLDLLSAGRGRNLTRISSLAWRPKGVFWDAEEHEYLTLQVRERHVEDLHGVGTFDQLVALSEAEQT